MIRKSFQFILRLTTLAVLLTGCDVGDAAQGIKVGAPQKRRVAMRGHLTGTREIYQVVTWQTLNPKSSSLPYAQAHLAIEAAGLTPRMLWQTNGGQTQYLVDQVQSADLDGDGIAEILSLWWVGASGAMLRIFHWEQDKQSFVELRPENELIGIQRYEITGRRVIAYARSDSAGEYEVRGSEIRRVGGGAGVATQGESGIEGQALIGPTRGGPTRQGMQSEKPYKTTLVILSAGDGREINRLETGSDGRFRVSLPPGNYLVGPPASANTRFAPRASEQLVKVLPGQFARVTINFDSGMR